MTARLQAWAAGDESARDTAVEGVYEVMRQLEDRRMRAEAHGMSLVSSGLAHEVFLRLIDQRQVAWQNRAQFFAVAARLMRRILVDRYRARNALKRGGGVSRVSLADDIAATVEGDLEALDRALARLAIQDPRQAQIVELRYFGGLSIEDAADAVGVSPATVKREWALARAWLKRELDDAG